MKRRLFSEDHEMFRDVVKKFISNSVLPEYEKWQEDGQIPKSVWIEAGQQGLVCPTASEDYGGSGADFLYSTILIEELYYNATSSFFLSLHNDIVFPYLDHLGSEEQKKKWLPKCVTGETILALALTEPNAGSDLAALTTTAIQDGKEYVLNGSKTFISNGQTADLFVVAVRTNAAADRPHRGISLVVVEGDRPGLRRGQNLKKIGLHAQDTSELYFEDCRIPPDNLLGEENRGFEYLMQNLQQERLVIAIGAVAAARGCLDLTREYVDSRQAFGKSLSQLQHVRFELAELATLVQLGESFVDDLIPRHMQGEDLVKEVSMAKYWTTDMQFQVADRCLQLFGGYGYMTEYPISRHFVDARVQRIYGGSNEIMKELIARKL